MVGVYVYMYAVVGTWVQIEECAICSSVGRGLSVWGARVQHEVAVAVAQ